MKHPIQITFFDMSTSTMHVIDSFDNIIGTGEDAIYNFIAIPRKGDIVNFMKEEPLYNSAQNYKVTEVNYSYRHFFNPEYVFTFIKVYVKKI